MKTPFSEILDESINHLKSGGDIASYLEKAGDNQNLRSAMEVCELALRVPTKPNELDSKQIWQKIESKIYTPAQSESKQFSWNFWNLSFSKPILAGIALLIAIGLVNATAVAAKNALPGETLYTVKKTVEKLQLTLTINDTKKTEIRIQQAETRLTEANTILSQSEATSTPLDHKKEQAVATAVGDLVNTNSLISSEGEAQKDKALLEKIVLLADKQQTVLSGIKEKVTGSAKDAVSAALGSASATEKVAKNSLAELESPVTSEDANATSTVEGILGGSATTSSSTTQGLDGSATSSSTPDLLETFGDPDASSTDEIILPPTASSTEETSTPIIINLR